MASNTEIRECIHHGLSQFVQYGPYTRKNGFKTSAFWRCLKCQRSARKNQYMKDSSQSKLKSKEWTRKFAKEHPEKMKERRRSVYERWHGKVWQIVFKHYGGNPPSCICCKENAPEFLCLDHVDGGGTRQRRELKMTSARFWAYLIRSDLPAGFRVLCCNCNFSYGAYGRCPHQEKQS